MLYKTASIRWFSLSLWIGSALACSAQAPGPIETGPEDAGVTQDVATTDTGARDVTSPQDTPVTPMDVTLPRDTGATMDLPRPTDTAMVDTVVVADSGPRDTGTGTDVVTVTDTGPRDTGTVTDTGPTFPPGSCGEPVAATSTGPTVDEATINFNWSMACFDRRNNSLFVFIEDTDVRGTALRFYDYLGAGGPATGDTVNLENFRARARPFFVSTISGIALEPMWHYDRDYLAYAGTATFTELRRTDPIGTRLRVRFQNLRARQVATYTDGTCRDVPSGGRMNVRDLTLDMTVNDLCTDQDCIDWAGGCM